MKSSASRSVALLVLPVSLALLVGVTGCTPSSTPAGAHSGATPKAISTAHDGTVTQVTHSPGGPSGYVGALKDVALTSCAAGTSPARFGGTVTNPTSTSQSYRIYVSLLSGGATIGVREVDVAAVGGRETQKWSGTLPVGKAGTSCVLRVERHS